MVHFSVFTITSMLCCLAPSLTPKSQKVISLKVERRYITFCFQVIYPPSQDASASFFPLSFYHSHQMHLFILWVGSFRVGRMWILFTLKNKRFICITCITIPALFKLYSTCQRVVDYSFSSNQVNEMFSHLVFAVGWVVFFQSHFLKKQSGISWNCVCS